MGDDALIAAARDALTLLALPRVGLRSWHQRVAEAGGVSAAIAQVATRDVLADARASAERDVTEAVRQECSLVVHGMAGYPTALHDLTAAESSEVSPAPPVLFARGDVARLQQPCVAIVGTRHATPAGLRIAERLAAGCADAGALVISGLARGVDAAAHTGALASRGGTCAIIGTGIDIAYPADHRALQQRIAREGLLLTESPPGARASRGSFPERNRLIAALASVTVVVEAGHRSGALLTASAAGVLGRTIAAVPGTIDVAAAQGSNALLRDGAQFITSVDDVLALLRIAPQPTVTRAAPPLLTDAERAIWNVLGDTPLDLELVVERAGWAADACLAAVTTLELKGLVRATHAGALQRA
jgi:DNA processing protein